MQGIAVLFAVVAFFAGVGVIRRRRVTRFAAVVDLVYFTLLTGAIVWSVIR